MNSLIQPRKFWTPARVVFSFITFALIAIIGVSSCSTPTTVSTNNNATEPGEGQPGTTAATNNRTSAPPVTTPLPPLPAALMNTELTALDGSKFKLADYHGKILLVNLWATWCGPCRSEIPDLVKVSQEYKARGVEIVGLTNENPETTEETVKDFVREYKINYKIGWAEQSFAIDLMQGQVRNNIPQSFVISRDGRVLKRFVGFSKVETPVKLRQALEDAVNEKQG